MLTVKTFLDRSAVHGIGLFADQAISKGDKIWEFNPSVDLVFDENQWMTLCSGITASSRSAIRRYSYKENGRYFVCIDNAQFMNHSDRHVNVVQIESENIMIAAADIKKGEELFCNYFEYSDADDIHAIALLALTDKNHQLPV